MVELAFDPTESRSGADLLIGGIPDSANPNETLPSQQEFRRRVRKCAHKSLSARRARHTFNRERIPFEDVPRNARVATQACGKIP